MDRDHPLPPDAQETSPAASEEWRRVYKNPENSPHFYIKAKDIMAGLWFTLAEELSSKGVSLPNDAVEFGAGTHPFVQNLIKALKLNSSASPKEHPNKETAKQKAQPFSFLRRMLLPHEKNQPDIRVHLIDPAYEFPERRQQARDNFFGITSGYSLSRENYEITFDQEHRIPNDFGPYNTVFVSVFNYFQTEEITALLSDERIRSVTFVNGPGLGSTQAEHFYPKTHEQIIDLLEALGFMMVGEVITEDDNPQNTEFAAGPITGGVFIRPINPEERAKLTAFSQHPMRRQLNVTDIMGSQNKGSNLFKFGQYGDEKMLVRTQKNTE